MVGGAGVSGALGSPGLATPPGPAQGAWARAYRYDPAPPQRRSTGNTAAPGEARTPTASNARWVGPPGGWAARATS